MLELNLLFSGSQFVLCLSANFFATTGPILVKLIAFSLALINLGQGEIIMKIGSVVLKLHRKYEICFIIIGIFRF